jgi:hypothetical protein
MKKQIMSRSYIYDQTHAESSTKLCSAEGKKVLTLCTELERTREKIIVASFDFYFHIPIKELEEAKCTLAIELGDSRHIFPEIIEVWQSKLAPALTL